MRGCSCGGLNWKSAGKTRRNDWLKGSRSWWTRSIPASPVLRGATYTEADLDEPDAGWRAFWRRRWRSDRSRAGRAESCSGSDAPWDAGLGQSFGREVRAKPCWLARHRGSLPDREPCRAGQARGSGRQCSAGKDALVQGLRNSHALGNILLSPQIEFTAAQIRKSRELFQELFDLPALAMTRAVWVRSGRRNCASCSVMSSRRAVPLQPIPCRRPRSPAHHAGWDARPVGDMVHHRPYRVRISCLMQKRILLTRSAASCVGRKKAFMMKCVLSWPCRTRISAMPQILQPTSCVRFWDDPRCYKGTAIQELKADFYALEGAYRANCSG